MWPINVISCKIYLGFDFFPLLSSGVGDTSHPDAEVKGFSVSVLRSFHKQ